MKLHLVETLHTVVGHFTKQTTTIGYGFMALLTIGGERLFSMVVEIVHRMLQEQGLEVARVVPLQREQERYAKFADQYATELAGKNVKCFFENKNPDKSEAKDAWEEVSTLYTFKKELKKYTSLQQYVEKPTDEEKALI
ncbi:hypothetical protein WMY93_025684 [Mugilogobius chulae]|uniref:Uncharacterized protein n=1 Tax=Mugilogobius chulae TaxID=88201 RepID=A0AAW0N4P7_9GOBI